MSLLNVRCYPLALQRLMLTPPTIVCRPLGETTHALPRGHSHKPHLGKAERSKQQIAGSADLGYRSLQELPNVSLFMSWALVVAGPRCKEEGICCLNKKKCVIKMWRKGQMKGSRKAISEYSKTNIYIFMNLNIIFFVFSIRPSGLDIVVKRSRCLHTK